MKKEMLINVLQAEECRIAILEDGVLEELYVERTGHESYVGNIYKGRIVNIEPSIQAAFVDFGVGRNGFLHVSDVEPTYWRHLDTRRGERDRDSGDQDRDRGRDRDRDRGDRRGRDRDRDRDRDKDRGRTVRVEVEREPLAPQETDTDVFDDVGMAPPAREATSNLGHGFDAGIDFGEGIDDAPVSPPPSKTRKSTEPLVAHPETRVEDEKEAKPRRRSRGGPRKKRGASDAPREPAEGDAPSAPDDSGDDPKPRLMDSAERRTDRGADEPGDSDLFFPTSRPPSRPAEPPPFTMPDVEPDEEFEEAEVEEEETQVEVFEEPDGEPEPPPPPRRRRVDHTRIEDALEADLAAAEVEEGEEPMLPVAVPGYQEDESRPDDAGMDDIDEEFPRPRREGRDRGDRGDRGDRRGGASRGRGGDRGGDRRGRNGRPASGGRPGAGMKWPLIQDVFKRGQEVIVQVIKEGIGSKGPTLSTYISIPGRYLVLMPCLNRTGVSRKIEDEEQRRRLRLMFNELKPPKGLGFIMRTAAIDKNKREVQRDLVYLCRLWQVLVRRIKKLKGPTEIYQESEMVTRTIRDNFTADIDSIWVDEQGAFDSAQEFMQVVMPRYADRIKHYEGSEPLFHKYGVEDEIHRIQLKKVPLPNGGSIVIEQTEALVAIDVNSGNFRADNNAEETAYQMNLHAAREIARQLRLRDLGGVIVNDFIDMRDEKHRRNVERALRDAMRRDRARTKILKISQFGIIEMTRQRVRPSLKRSGYMDCPHCKGNSMVKTPETMALEILRLIQMASTREPVVRVEIGVPGDVAEYLLNRKRREIVRWEETRGMSVNIRGMHAVAPEHLEFVCLDRNDNEVRLTQPEPLPFRPRR